MGAWGRRAAAMAGVVVEGGLAFHEGKRCESSLLRLAFQTLVSSHVLFMYSSSRTTSDRKAYTHARARHREGGAGRPITPWYTECGQTARPGCARRETAVAFRPFGSSAC